MPESSKLLMDSMSSLDLSSSTKSGGYSQTQQQQQQQLIQQQQQQQQLQVTEKPSHYTYLKGFRVDQCALFLQHKCTQHRPYTCFYWHFKNQRRRRPVRRRDGSFNYNPDVYCEKYDEQTGLCQNGDECPHVHRNAGDTEKRYHLRYYKTAICIHETDTKGNCVKNGPHCAFAHGTNDLRPPVYDIKELQAQQLLQSNNSTSSSASTTSTASTSSSSSSSCETSSQHDLLINEKAQTLANSLERERMLNEDPKWNDTAYVLVNYKTESCKRPARLCRQGFACPQYHNQRDRRRNPSLIKYRSTPCPNVKQGDDWLEPSVCENGDSCKYCHSRTEQQFHPEIYKSSKCNDMISTGYCPRGPFCAFAHVEAELKTQRTHSASESSSSDYTLECFMPNVVLKSDRKDSKDHHHHLTRTSNNENVVVVSSGSSGSGVLDDAEFEHDVSDNLISQNSSQAGGRKNSNTSGQQSVSSAAAATTFAGIVLGNTTNNLNSNSSISLDSSDNSSQALQNFKNQLMNAAALMTSSGINNGLVNQMSEYQQQQSQLTAAANCQSYTKPIGSERERPVNKVTSSLLSAALGVSQTAQYQQYLLGASSSASSSSSSPISSLSRSQNSSSQVTTGGGTGRDGSSAQASISSPNTTSSSDLTTSLIRAATPTTTTSTNVSSNNGILGLAANQPAVSQSPTPHSLVMLSNFDKEKLLQDLKVQTEMSKKLEAICLQYKQWVDKLTCEVNEWKLKYIRCETERKALELQFLNKFSNATSTTSNENIFDTTSTTAKINL